MSIGTSQLNKTQIGLSNVNNTSDINKPVSTAQQTALDLKSNITTTPQWIKITKTYTDLSIAGLTNNITLLTLPIKGYIHDVKIVPTTAFSGGLIATYTLSVGISGSLAKYGAIVDVFTGNITSNLIHTPLAGLESTSGTTAIKLSAISTVANLSSATAGSVDIYILTSLVP